MKTREIVLTAMLLALCVVFQSMKGFSVYLTGSAVNTILVMATLSVGVGSGLIIAALTPIIAYFMGATPILQVIPLMILVIMAGNAVLVIATGIFKEKNLVAGLISGAVLKAAVLWILVWYAILPYFGSGLPDPMKMAVKASFSVTQLITALIGCGIALVLHQRLKTYYQNN